MRNHLRWISASVWASASLVGSGCGEDAASGSVACGPGTVRSGDQCVPVSPTEDAGPGGGEPGGGGTTGGGGNPQGGGEPGGGGNPQGGGEPGGGGEPQGGGSAGGGGSPVGGGEPGGGGLPITLDDFFAPSGFMGDGEQPGGIEVADCPPKGDAVGACRAYTWTPGAQGWAGVWWQHPEGNWGGPDGLPGFDMPPGAAQVSFLAWGESGGEVVSFGAGIGDVDGFSRNLPEVTLTDTPTRYRMDLRGVEYDDIVGGFSWVAGGAAAPVTLYITDLQWTDSVEGLSAEPIGDALPLPVVVDDHWSPSGFMGDGEQPGGIEVGECAERGSPDAAGVCRRFQWNPGRNGWAGIFWQYPENNWGALPGRAIAPGATEVSFLAWGELGGELVSFGAGMGDVDGFSAGLPQVVLEGTPTPYTISLVGQPYDEVVGAFTWTTNESAAPVAFYVDDLRWR